MIYKGLKLFTMLFLVIVQTIQAQTDKATDTVTDIDSNIYKTVIIGTQTWMAENLKTTRYNNGDVIGTTIPDTLDYSSENTPKYQWAYNGNENNATLYGRLYTWYTITDSRDVCPNGWHVPTFDEWKTLTNFLGGKSIAHNKLKETGIKHWKSPNASATNESGFTALPAGSRWDKAFSQLGSYTHFWTGTENDNDTAWRQLLEENGCWGYAPKSIGWPVRCIKD